MSLLAVAGLEKRFGDRSLFSAVTFRLARRDRVGLVGPNGCGKTTLLRVLAGVTDGDAGALTRSRGIRIGLLDQELPAGEAPTIEDLVRCARSRLDALEAEMRELEGRLDDPAAIARYAEVSAAFEHGGGYGFAGEVERVLGGLGLGGFARSRPLASLSGGERARVGLARLLLEDADLLLLDEPTNHLDLAALEWLERHLLERERTFVVASHDRYFLDRVTNRTLAFVDGAVRAYRGAYSAFVRRREQEVAAEGRTPETRRPLARAWRLAALPLGSAWVLETTPLAVGFSRGAPLLRAPVLRVEPGARVAIIGPNGSGKTALLRTLLGEQAPLEGHIRAAPGARVASLAQSGSVALAGGTVLEAFLAGSPWTEQEARDFLARFLFRGEDVFRDVARLSLGERSRLALARVAARPANLLALDEPTNHLDLPSREALEAVLSAYEGTVLLASHDRYFVDRLATHVWLVDRGAVRCFAGNYTATRRALAAEASAARAGAGAPAGRRMPGPPGALSRRLRLPPEGLGAVARERGVRPRPHRSADTLAELEARIAALEQRLEALAQRVTEVAEAGNYLESRRVGEEYAELERSLRELYQEWARSEERS